MDTVLDILKRAGLEESAWGKRIIGAEVKGSFTTEEKELAGHWPTCACGETYVKNPYETYERVIVTDPEESYAPVDNILQELGNDFSMVVTRDNFKGSAALMVKIENRAFDLSVASNYRSKPDY